MSTIEYRDLFSELANYEKKGVGLSMEGERASPMQIVNAHILKEDVAYMRDYVLDDQGNIEKLDFHNVKPYHMEYQKLE